MRCAGDVLPKSRIGRSFFLFSSISLTILLSYSSPHLNALYDRINSKPLRDGGDSGPAQTRDASSFNDHRDEPVVERKLVNVNAREHGDTSSFNDDHYDDEPVVDVAIANGSADDDEDGNQQSTRSRPVQNETAGVPVQQRQPINLPIDIEERVPSVDELYQKIAIVSAFSQNHYREALAFIASAQRTMPDKKIIIYDLGIQASTVPKVRALCNVELREFPWSSYPEHVKSLHNYAWKPVLIDITLREFGAIMWGDASVRFKLSLKKLMPFPAKHHGFMSHWHGFDPKKKSVVQHQYFHTNPNMYANLGVDRKEYYQSKDLAAYPAANRQLYVNSSVIQRSIVQPMLKCALELRCIAPKGSKVGTHRFDASLLAILIYKNMRGEWTPNDNFNHIFDKVIGIQRNTKGSENARICKK